MFLVGNWRCLKLDKKKLDLLKAVEALELRVVRLEEVVVKHRHASVDVVVCDAPGKV